MFHQFTQIMKEHPNQKLLLILLGIYNLRHRRRYHRTNSSSLNLQVQYYIKISNITSYIHLIEYYIIFKRINSYLLRFIYYRNAQNCFKSNSSSNNHTFSRWTILCISGSHKSSWFWCKKTIFPNRIRTNGWRYSKRRIGSTCS